MPGRAGCSREPAARPLGGMFMQRSRITLLCAFALGSLATVVALPIAFSGRDHQKDLAPDAQAALSAAPTLANAAPPAVQPPQGQLTPLPSLAPLVKQLRPVVVNINSRFKPRRATARRGVPPARPRTPFDQGPGDDGEDGGDQQDPMERFFRFFGGQPTPDDQERPGLGSGFLIGHGIVLTTPHVVEMQDPGP